MDVPLLLFPPNTYFTARLALMSDDMDYSQEMVFDPDQDPEEKRAVRQNYRTLTKRLEEHQGNPNDVTADELLTQIRTADKLFEKVKGPQEATLDSRLLLMASNMGAQKARALKSGSGAFEVDDFVSKLVQYMGGQRTIEDTLPDDSDADEIPDIGPYLDWDRIGRKVMAKSRRVPLTGFMLGPLSIEQKKRKIVTRAKLEKNKEDQSRPQEIKEEDISRSENETAGNVALLVKILEEIGDPINVFEFFINPNDFAQSVENLFYLSFLIRDGKAVFDIEDGVPLIYACEPPSQAQYDQGLKKRQMVFEFDKATWKRAIEVFKITEPVIPQRAPSKIRLGDKWYG